MEPAPARYSAGLAPPISERFNISRWWLVAPAGVFVWLVILICFFAIILFLNAPDDFIDLLIVDALLIFLLLLERRFIGIGTSVTITSASFALTVAGSAGLLLGTFVRNIAGNYHIPPS